MLAEFTHKAGQSGAYCFDRSPLLEQRRFVFDLISSRPRFDLISESLKLLDFAFEVLLKLVALRSIRGVLDLFVYALKCRNAFGDLLKGLIDLLLRLSRCHGGCSHVPSGLENGLGRQNRGDIDVPATCVTKLLRKANVPARPEDSRGSPTRCCLRVSLE